MFVDFLGSEVYEITEHFTMQHIPDYERVFCGEDSRSHRLICNQWMITLRGLVSKKLCTLLIPLSFSWMNAPI